MSLEDLEPLYGVAKGGFGLKVLEQLIKPITALHEPGTLNGIGLLQQYCPRSFMALKQ